MIRGILRAEEDAGPAKSGEARERGGILPAEDSESLIRKFGKAGYLSYVHNIKINNMAKRLTQYEIDAILGQVVSEIESKKGKLIKDSDVVEMEKKAQADRDRLITLGKEYDSLLAQVKNEHSAFAKKKGLSVDTWGFTTNKDPEQFYSTNKSISGDIKTQIKNQIILSGLKLDNLDTLIGDLVKKFGK